MEPEINKEEEWNRASITSDPFSKPFIDNYCSENAFSTGLSREDILELGFLRTNPERSIWKHIDKPNLFLQILYEKDYSVKDVTVDRVIIYKSLSGFTPFPRLYSSTKPNKQDIQQVINSYAG